jgi:hypothetical protein
MYALIFPNGETLQYNGKTLWFSEIVAKLLAHELNLSIAHQSEWTYSI